MNRWLRVEQELSQFILMGTLMTEELRLFTAELLFFHLYDPGFNAEEKLKLSDIPEGYPNWHRLFRRLLKEKSLQKLTFNNEDFAFSIARETLDWCRRTYQDYETSRTFIREEKDLEELSKQRTKNESETWIQAISSLEELYPNHEKSWEFYRKRIGEETELLNEVSQEDGNRKRIEQGISVLKQNILQDWRKFLYQKQHSQEEEFLEEEFGQYLRELHQKVGQLQELGDLLAPFYNFLGHVWNDSIGNWNKIDWDKLEEVAKDMARDKHLRELAELLGRWQQAEQVIEERKMQKPMPREEWKPSPYGKSEISGIHHSDHISAMLPSEIALLSTEQTELVFSKKYVEKKLLTFKYRSEDINNTSEIQESISTKVESDQKGPIVICIDTSGSMFGAPERISKALALAILNISLKQKRRAYLISFSTGIKTFEMTGMEKDLSQLIDFLKMSFHGGTDIQPALDEALIVLKKTTFKKADVLVISDFLIPRIDRHIFNQIQEYRLKHSTRFHSLFITRRPDPNIPPLPIFDNHWVYDLDHPGVMRQTIDHFQTLEESQDEL